MFNRPYDLAIIAGLIGIVVVTIGIGLTDIQDEGVTESSAFFAKIEGNMTSGSGLKGLSNETASSLRGGQEGEQSEEGFLVRGSRGLLKLGQSFTTFRSTATAAEQELSIPSVIVDILFSMVLIVFAVLIYTWWRGK